jgi:hypothetical protein
VKRPAAALIVLPALLLGALSLASARAAFSTLGADATLEEVRTGTRPGAARLLAAAADYHAAAGSFESARYSTAAASALIAATRAGAKVPDREIEAQLRAALRASPASPFNWSRLAWMRFRAGDNKGAATAWQMSVMTGRYKPPVMQSRLELGLRLLGSQDSAFEDALRDQIVVAARTDGASLAALANRLGAQAIVRAALQNDEGALALYESANKQLQDELSRRVKATAR